MNLFEDFNFNYVMWHTFRVHAILKAPSLKLEFHADCELLDMNAKNQTQALCISSGLS